MQIYKTCDGCADEALKAAIWRIRYGRQRDKDRPAKCCRDGQTLQVRLARPRFLL